MFRFNPPGSGQPPVTFNGGTTAGEPDPRRQAVARQVAGVLADLAEMEMKASNTYNDWARQVERHGLPRVASELYGLASENGGRATRLAEMGQQVMRDAGLWQG